MNKTTTTLLIILLTTLFVIPSFGQNPTKRLDKKMMKQLTKEFIYELKTENFYKLPPEYQKEKFDETIPFYDPPGLIEQWEWKSTYTNDTINLYINYLRCNDSTLYRYAKKRLTETFKDKTLFDLEYRIAFIRVDTVKGDTIVCFDTEFSFSESFDRYEWLTTTYPPKGLLEINTLPIVVYGNFADKFFDVIENSPMKAPLLPHNTMRSRWDGYSFAKKFSCKHQIYKNGKLKRCPKDNFLPNKKRGWGTIYDDKEYLDYIRKGHK